MADNLSSETARSLRLLMTADAVGGVWQYAVDLISELAGSGFEVLLATMGPRPSGQQRQQIAGISRTRLVESDWALEWMPSPWSDVERAGKWLLDLQREFQADVIHLNGYAHASLPWRRPVLTVAHSCVFSWWRSVHGEGAGPEWDEYRAKVAAGLRASSATATPTQHMAACLEREYGIPRNAVHVVPNFTRTKLSSSTPKQPFFLASGRFWDEAKNLRLLDRIAPALTWPVRIAGSNVGPEGREVSATAAKLLGTLPHSELMKEMEAAAVFVHPALYEPFGLAVLEAARASCCLVLSDIPSLRELWDEAAVFINPQDAAAWAAELAALEENSEKRKMLARRAQERSLQYCPENSVSKYASLYRRLIHTGEETAA